MASIEIPHAAGNCPINDELDHLEFWLPGLSYGMWRPLEAIVERQDTLERTLRDEIYDKLAMSHDLVALVSVNEQLRLMELTKRVRAK